MNTGAINQLTEQMQALVLSRTQITTTVTDVKTTITQLTLTGQGEQLSLPERTGASEQPLVIEASASTATTSGERIKAALALNTALTDRELAAIVGCSASTANKWKRRLLQAA